MLLALASLPALRPSTPPHFTGSCPRSRRSSSTFRPILPPPRQAAPRTPLKARALRPVQPMRRHPPPPPPSRPSRRRPPPFQILLFPRHRLEGCWSGLRGPLACRAILSSAHPQMTLRYHRHRASPSCDLAGRATAAAPLRRLRCSLVQPTFLWLLPLRQPHL